MAHGSGMNYTRRLKMIGKLVSLELEFYEAALEKTKNPDEQKDIYRDFLYNLYEGMGDDTLQEFWENTLKKYRSLL
jgi:hypothetical protein